MSQERRFNVAVAGATGAVGGAMLDVLERRNFPLGELRLLASERSVGKKLTFKGKEIVVQQLTKDAFSGIDVALFSAGGSRSLEFAPAAARAGAVVVDNSSAFRMDDDIPLVVPEVNAHAIAQYTKRGIIANPNCSTIQMVVALKPLHDAMPIERVVVSTYQAVSGAGGKAMDELAKQTGQLMNGQAAEVNVLPARIAFNVIPHIDVFMEDGYTKEEHKMMDETRKIMEADIAVTATTVRVPVFYGHSESVNITFSGPMNAAKARELLAEAEGICVVDDPSGEDYPMPSEAAGTDPVWVGRIRDDYSCANSLHLWVVADNVRKGAALNAVQIAEILISQS
ncbi:aspartate-semialdehyde dehydrogenase [bacterium]|nr:aspartate-semialdehyde dehydrogenase [bacterium]